MNYKFGYKKVLISFASCIAMTKQPVMRSREFHRCLQRNPVLLYDGSITAPSKKIISNGLRRLYLMGFLRRKKVPREVKTKSGRMGTKGYEYLYTLSNQGWRYIAHLITQKEDVDTLTLRADEIFLLEKFREWGVVNKENEYEVRVFIKFLRETNLLKNLVNTLKPHREAKEYIEAMKSSGRISSLKDEVAAVTIMNIIYDEEDEEPPRRSKFIPRWKITEERCLNAIKEQDALLRKNMDKIQEKEKIIKKLREENERLGKVRAEMEEEIEKLKDTIHTLEQEIEKLRNKGRSYRQEIEELNNEVSRYSEENKKLKNILKKIKNESEDTINNLLKRCKNLNNILNELRGKYNELNEKYYQCMIRAESLNAMLEIYKEGEKKG